MGKAGRDGPDPGSEAGSAERRGAALWAERIAVTYLDGGRPALGGVDFRLGRGECLGVTGGAGAGKTTLLLALSGAIPGLVPARLDGRVLVGDRCASAFGPGEAGRRVSLVLQDPEAQLCGGTVWEDVVFGLENRGWEPGRIRARAEWALRATGMWALRDRAPAALSGGQRQRAVLASALAPGAEILLLDEPATQLDPEGADHLYRLLAELRREGMTLVIADRDLERLAPLADRLLLLREGRPAWFGLTREVLEMLAPAYLEGRLEPFLPDATAAALRLREDGLYAAAVPLDEEEFCRLVSGGGRVA